VPNPRSVGARPKTLGSGKKVKRKLFFFVFSEAKSIIVLHMEIEKT
jgi:hypothetical protein